MSEHWHDDEALVDRVNASHCVAIKLSEWITEQADTYGLSLHEMLGVLQVNVARLTDEMGDRLSDVLLELGRKPL